MIDAVEKFLNVAFEDKTGTGIVGTDFSNSVPKIQHSLVSAFADSAGERGGNEGWLKYGIQYFKHRVMEDSVTDGCLVDMTSFRIAYPKRIISAVPVGTIFKFPIELENVFFKLPLEPCHIRPVSLVRLEHIPRAKERLWRNY